MIRPRSVLLGILGAEAISMLGGRVSAYALTWLVLTSTNDPIKVGMIASAALIPYVLAAALGAPLIDRVGPRRMTIGADTACALLIGATALAYHGPFALLLGLVVVVGSCSGLGDHSRRVLLANAVKTAGGDSARITGAYESIARLVTLVGLPAGGFVIWWIGAPTAILINAVSYGLCAILMAVIVRPRAAADLHAEAAPEPYFTALRGGVRFVWQDKLMFSVIAMVFITNLCNQAHSLFIPLWINALLHSPKELGFISAAFALGALLGNLVFTALASRVSRYLTLVIGYLIGGAPRFLILAFSHNMILVLSVIFVSGIAMASVNPIIGAMMFDRVPEKMQARVFGLTTAVAYGGMPLGGLLGGLAAKELGVTAGLIIAACVYFTATLTPVVGYKLWRGLDKKKVPEPLVVASEPLAVA